MYEFDYFASISRLARDACHRTSEAATGELTLYFGTAVPEPATLTLLVSALLGLGAFYLRRRRAKA